MSILIKGMKMPRNCDDCHFDIDCPYDESQDGYKMIGGRPCKCPLVSVPPHGRLGDLDALAAKCDDPYWCVWLSEIEDAPTIIPAEEVRE